MQLLTIIVIFIILLFSFKLIDRCRCYLYLQHFSASITMNRIINYTIKYFSLYDTFMIHYLHSNAGYYWCNISLSCNWSLRLWLRLRESLLHPWSRSIKLKFHYNDYIIIGRWLHPPAFMYHFKYFVLILQILLYTLFMIYYLHSNARYYWYWCNISPSCNWYLRIRLQLRESLLHPWSRSIKLKFHYNDYIIIGRWLHPPAFKHHINFTPSQLLIQLFNEVCWTFSWHLKLNGVRYVDIVHVNSLRQIFLSQKK